MAEFRIGTCSWKYESWRGLIYPQSSKINFLEEYSGHYSTVEIDQWFWSLFGENKVNLPNPKIIEEYINSVPEDFKFSIKLPNSLTLTHFYKSNKAEPLKSNPYFLSKELYKQIKQIFKPFGEKLGPLMMQFEYLNKQKMNSQLDFQIRFKGFLDSIDTNKNIGVEIRNPNYLNNSFFEFLQKNNIIPVLLQGYYMPPVYETYNKFRNLFTEKVIIRLHGPDRKGIEETTGGDWSKIVESKDDELNKIIDMVIDLLSRDVDVYMNVNNHYEGSAPLTIQKIQDKIKHK
ncbi:MAG: DUF72 domain-containing protein [Bacteroidetes bacterium]|nr:DUF72 domain-containing protein [Bacteroidota bacterium]